MDRTIYIGSIEEYLKLDKKKTEDPDKYKKFEIVVDINKLRKEVRNEMTDQNNEEKKFTQEEKIVMEYIEKHPNVSYREAVLATLDKSEKETKKEYTKEEKKEEEQYIQKEKEDLEKVGKYIEKNPGTEYREAVKIVLGKDNQSNNEKKVEEYIEKHPNVSYREAVLATLDKSEEEGSEKTDQEIINMNVTIDDLIYGLNKAGKSAVFESDDKSKLNKALDLITEIKESLKKIIDKKD